MDSTSDTPILRTKLHRPPVAEDIVPRKDLFERLDRGRNLPLTLVSAPAGYGKTSLISQWLETRGHPHAWLSIDQTENDLRRFLSYFIQAVQGLFPGSLEQTSALVSAGGTLPANAVSATLVNDLDSLGSECLLVLDDFHRMWSREANDLLDALLEHPPRGFHLVIVCRRDPGLRLHSLRARGMMNEVRAGELKLDRDAAAEFLQRACSRTLAPEILERIHSDTEGWPVGLRLTALAIRFSQSGTETVSSGGPTSETQGYLVDEIMSRLPDHLVVNLRRISILDRFCASLCDALFDPEQTPESLDGKGFINELVSAGLLVIALDEYGVWYRLHHLFQEMLQRQLHRTETAEAITRLHLNATDCLESQGLIEEAMHHALSAGRPDRAGEVIISARQGMLAGEQGQRLSTLLGLLPEEQIAVNPDLLLLRAYELNYLGDEAGMTEAAEKAEALLTGDDALTAAMGVRRHELNIFSSWDRYSKGNYDEAETLAGRALQHLDSGTNLQRAWAIQMMMFCLQAKDKTPEARDLVQRSMAGLETSKPSIYGNCLTSLLYLDCTSGDLESLVSDGRIAARFSEQSGLQETHEIALSFIALGQYQMNLLEEADSTLSRLTDLPYFGSRFAHRRALILHCLVHQARSRTQEALDLLDRKSQALLALGNTDYLRALEALRNLLLSRNGEQARASQWASDFEPRLSTDPDFVFFPGLALAEVLIAQGEAESLQRAKRVLCEHQAFFERGNRIPYLIETHVLSALLDQALGRSETALDHMQLAVTLSQPGRFLRVFADRGVEVVQLLNQLDLDSDGVRYVGEIQSAIQPMDERSDLKAAGARPASSPSAAQEILTGRELQILQLIATHKSNKEIAEQLFIAPGTVRRHTENIYQKLGVHKRMDAVDKATGLGIL